MQLDTWQLLSNLRVWQIHVEAMVTYAGDFYGQTIRVCMEYAEVWYTTQKWWVF